MNINKNDKVIESMVEIFCTKLGLAKSRSKLMGCKTPDCVVARKFIPPYTNGFQRGNSPDAMESLIKNLLGR